MAAYYGNRSAAYIMLGQYKQALHDAQQSIRIDANFVKGHIREAKCHLVMGDLDSARQSLNNVISLDANNQEAVNELANCDKLSRIMSEVDKHVQQQDHRSVVYYSSRVLDTAPECVKYKLIKAESLALSQRYQEAQDIVTDIIRFDQMNVDALCIRGMVLYYQDNLEKAINHFQQAMKLSPDHRKCLALYKKVKSLKSKKESGNAAYKANQLQEALSLYSEALAIDPLNHAMNAKLYFNRALVQTKVMSR